MFLLEVNANFYDRKPIEKELKLESRRSNVQIDPRPFCCNEFYADDDYVDMMFDITYKYSYQETEVVVNDDDDNDSGDDDGDHRDRFATRTTRASTTSTTITVIFSRRKNDDLLFWQDTLYFRVYDASVEHVPSFHTTTYTYLGIDGEKVPRNTIVGIVHPSVTIIQKDAFEHCHEMKHCIIHDDVDIIQEDAFYACKALKTIRLSRNLKCIGERAFRACSSLDAIFIPPSMERIDNYAFSFCARLKIFSLPLRTHKQIENGIAIELGSDLLSKCHDFFILMRTYSHIQEHEYDANNYQPIFDLYGNQPPLHRACLDVNVNAQSIQKCVSVLVNENSQDSGSEETKIMKDATHAEEVALMTMYGGFTPLHILVMNPYAIDVDDDNNAGTILACLSLNLNAAFATDDSNMSPIDYLWKHGTSQSIDCLICIMQALCLHREIEAVK